MKKTVLTKRLREALIISAMAEEIAMADGWNNLDECLQTSPIMGDTYLKYAAAGWRGVKRMKSPDEFSFYGTIEDDLDPNAATIPAKRRLC